MSEKQRRRWLSLPLWLALPFIVIMVFLISAYGSDLSRLLTIAAKMVVIQ